MNIRYKISDIKNKNEKSKILSYFFFLFLLSSLFSLVFPAGLSFAKMKVEKNQVATAIPTIYPRSAWSSAADEKRTKKIWPAEYETPEVIIVHHTATNYKDATSKQIKKIYRYHSYTKKWGDIGYNYIIGKDGAIFEGRYGGNGVIGGHSYFDGTNYNKGSIGIAVLGNYVGEKLSAASLDSLQKLIGWLAANNSIGINSEIKFHDKKLDSAVIGHKDVADTACPGKNIYNNLGSIRTASANFENTYANYAYKTSGDGTAYEISGGKKYSGSAKQPVVEISSTQLAAYSSNGGVQASVASENYPSGTLFEVSGSEQRGILENGSIRPISSAAVLAANYNAANFVEISQEKWNSYPAGSAATFRSGAFLKDEAGNFYLISENKKRLLALPEAEKSRVDYSRFIETAGSELAAYENGENITTAADFPAGTIITTGSRNYFYIQSDAVKRKISAAVFNANFSSEMLVKVSSKFARLYKTKGSLSLQNGAIVNYSKNDYFIENGSRRQFSAKNLAASMGYQNIVKAKRTEMSGIGNGAKIE